jgi:integrase
MAEPSPANNSTPARVRIPQNRGKPLLVVADPTGAPLIDGRIFLAWQKTDGRFFIGRTKPRVYLGRGYDAARYRYRDFVRGNEKDPTVWGQMGKSLAIVDAPPGVTLDPLFQSVIKPILRFDDPETLYCIRRWILGDPKEAARRLEIPELARLSSLPPVLPSVGLSAVHDAYVGKRKRPSPKELAAVKRYWDSFADAVTPAVTVSDVSAERVRAWADSAYAPLGSGGSPKMVRHRIEYVRRVFAYAARQGVDSAECERVLKEIRKIELPDLAATDPRPISRQHFEKLFAAADERWRAILLLALNCAFYPVDVRTVPKSAIDLEAGTLVFERAKTKTARVAVLWSRTIDALRAYQRAEPHDSESVFITQYGSAYTEKGLNTAYRWLRDEAGVPDGIEFAHIRDGAYSAAIEGGADVLHAQILAGHKTGVQDHYIKRNPRMVTDACGAIERAYFGNDRGPQRTSARAQTTRSKR